MLTRLDSMPVGSFHYKLLFVVGLGWAFDAMDTGIIAFILPLLSKEWGLSSSEVGILGSVGLVGMAVGAIVSGMIADYIGRKKVLTLTVLLYSISTGLCAVANSYESLVFFRFLVGVGLGGELPVAATLVTEYVPSRVRGRFIVILESFWAVGWLLAAFIAYTIIPLYGWRVALGIGALPALYVAIIRTHVPESIRFYLSKGKLVEAEKIILHIEQILKVKSLPFLKSEIEIDKTENGSLKHLWREPYTKRTLMLWIVWFGIVFSYYGIFMWLPSLVYQQGFSIVKTSEYLLLMTLAQLPGYISAALLVEKWGRKYTLAVFLLGSGLSSYFFGHATSEGIILLSGAFMSFFNLGAWGVIYAYTPELYPTYIRARGCGWAAGIGRIGGMVAPILVGILLADNWPISGIFYLFSSVFVIISIIIILLGVESKQKELDHI